MCDYGAYSYVNEMNRIYILCTPSPWQAYTLFSRWYDYRTCSRRVKEGLRGIRSTHTQPPYLLLFLCVFHHAPQRSITCLVFAHSHIISLQYIATKSAAAAHIHTYTHVNRSRTIVQPRIVYGDPAYTRWCSVQPKRGSGWETRKLRSGICVKLGCTGCLCRPIVCIYARTFDDISYYIYDVVVVFFR